MHLPPFRRLMPLLAAALLIGSCSADDTVNTPPGSIALRLSPSAATVAPGGSVQVTATITRNNFDGDIGVALVDSARGMNAFVSDSSITSPDSAVMILNVSSTGSLGTYIMTVIAIPQGASTVSRDFTMTVVPPPGVRR